MSIVRCSKPDGQHLLWLESDPLPPPGADAPGRSIDRALDGGASDRWGERSVAVARWAAGLMAQLGYFAPTFRSGIWLLYDRAEQR